MSLATQMATDLANIAANDVWGTPTQLTFGAETVTAIVSPENKMKDMEDAGYMLNYDRSAVVIKAAFVTEPSEHSAVTISGTSYRVTRLTDDGVALTLEMKRNN